MTKPTEALTEPEMTKPTEALTEPEMTKPAEVFTELEAADFLRCSPSFLRHARVRGDGPAFSYLSPRAIRYRRADLEAYLAQRLAQNTLYPSRRDAAQDKAVR